jgi:hypothetical protein
VREKSSLVRTDKNVFLHIKDKTSLMCKIEKGKTMNWIHVFLPLAFGIVFFSLGIAFSYLRYRIKRDISFYKFSRSILLLIMILWCMFVVLSEYFHIPFYFVIVFIPVIGVIVFLCSAFISHKKRR